MGGSGSGAADCTPGSIVWVRRRNGSWWPGRILGPEELADSHLTSPRAGTPVKLLGREDASVDWYNLEKSKRVKAFRCDEFNGCIEKVESSQIMPSKKREKYASREDAILHALELEKQQLRKQGHFDVANNELSSFSKPPVVFENMPPGSKQSGGNDELLTVTKGLATFSNDESLSGLYLDNLKGSEEEREEDGVLEGTPRMRKLQDFGLKIAPSKRKHPYSAAASAAATAMNGFGKPKLNAHALPIGVPSMRDTYVNGGEEIGGYCRAKRSRCMYLSEDQYRHVDDKESYRSKIQISPSTSGEGNPHLLFRGNGSRLPDGLDGGSSDYYLSESGSDSSETEQITNEETSSLSDMSGMAGNKAQFQEPVGSMSSEDPGGPAAAFSVGLRRHGASQAVSKWQLKGKRNIRNLTRQHQPLDGAGGKGLIGSNHQVRPVAYREINGFKQRPPTKWVSQGRIIVDNEDGEEDEIDVNEEDWDDAHFFREHHPPGVSSSRQRWRGHSLLRHNNKFPHHPSDWGEGATTLEAQGPKQQQQQQNGPPFGAGAVAVGGLGQFVGDGRRKGVLFEVDLKVQVTYPKQRVPIVALTNKVNGNSIIGHSIQIEAVEDGSSDHHLLSASNYCEAAAANETTTPTGSSRIPAWRTARRTANFRVPRSNPAATAAFEDGDEEDDDVGGGGGGFIYNSNKNVDYERSKFLKSSSTTSVSQKGFLVRRSLLDHPPQSQQQHSNSNSNSRRKRVSLSSTPCKQKVRTLSSIAVQQNKNKWASSIIRSHNNTSNISSSSRNMVEAGGLIEPGTSSRPTTVACIPVKLVFSRLLEKINRPPSRALTNLSKLHAAAAAAAAVVASTDREIVNA